MINYRRCSWLALIAFIAIGFASAAQARDKFPRPEELRAPIAFWTRVYTQVDSNSGYIHDAEHLDIIYQTIRFGDDSRSERRHAVKRADSHYRDILKALGRGTRKGLSKEAQRVLALWPKGTSNEQFRHAAGQLRFQLGQADRFRAGMVRSGRWRDYIERILKTNDVPVELVALPHVESSFDPDAYSKVGAAGLWQFTRSTGLRYMRINHVVDERRDPYLSTEAAARLLKDNYDVLKTWPLAITAYNHGQAGMRRAAQEFGPHIGVIVEKYQSRTFGFASRNFYAAFVAALDIDEHPEKYFGDMSLSPPLKTIVTPVPDYMRASTLADALGLQLTALQRLNPALQSTVWHNDKFVPRNFPLRLPATANDAADLIAAIPQTQRYTTQRPDVSHRIRSGETLSGIADDYNISLAALMRLNGLSNRNFIRAGQVLALPLRSHETPETLAAANGSGGEYVVRRGDNLDSIAEAYDMNVSDLLAANQIRNKNRIYVGQTLKVPQATAGSAGDAGLGSVDGQAAADVIAVAAVGEAGASITDAVATTSEDAAEVVLTDASLVTKTFSPPVEQPDADSERVADTQAAVDGATDGAIGDGGDDETTASPDANALASAQADLAADPTDYSVADNGTIMVQSLETLGHYADWLGIRTQHLRDINGLPFGHAVVIGQSLKLDFSKVSADQFEQRRVAYHQQLQEQFFSTYRIASVEEHVVKRGESLWLLALRTYSVPIWLLRQYNPDLDLDHVSPGTVVKFPHLTTIQDDGAG